MRTKVIFMRSFLYRSVKKCNRNNFDEAIFLFAWSLASHVFQFVILRVSVEPVDVAVVSNVSFLLVFFLDKSFNKKRFQTVMYCVLQLQSSATRVSCNAHFESIWKKTCVCLFDWFCLSVYFDKPQTVLLLLYTHTHYIYI